MIRFPRGLAAADTDLSHAWHLSPTRWHARGTKLSFSSALIALLLVTAGWSTVAIGQDKDEPAKIAEAADTKEDATKDLEAATQRKADKPVAANQSDPDTKQDKAVSKRLAVKQVSSSSVGRLPVSTADGRPLLPIGVFHSQLAEVVPKSFRPVAIQQLSEAISESKQQGNSDLASRIRSSFYDVRLKDDTLVCDQSVLELQTQQQGVVRHPLGRVNLAIRQPRILAGATTSLSSDARLESDEDGALTAVFDGRSSEGHASLRFRWSLRGRPFGMGREYTLRLPRSPQTRIVLSVPSDISLETLDGVLRRHPDPPPDADVSTRSSDANWYVLDAGGLSTIRLRTRRSTDIDGMDLVTVRQSSISYAIDSTGVNWTHRMRIQVPQTRVLPALRIEHGVVTSVRVDSIETSFRRRDRQGDGQGVAQFVEIPMTLSSVRDDASLALTIEGNCTWQSDGWLNLPLPRWDADEVSQTQVIDQAALVVASPLRVVSWELPDDWTQQVEVESQDRSTVFRASGPPIASIPRGIRSIAKLSSEKPPAAKKKNRSKLPSNQERGRSVWSRVRLADQPGELKSDATLRLEVSKNATEVDRGLNASMWLSMNLDGNRIDPILFRVQPGWTLLSLSVPRSGRMIESPRVNNANRTFRFWPDLEDFDGDTILVRATGRRRIPSTDEHTSIPASWFLRADGLLGTLDAVAVPPSDLTWTADACLARDRIAVSEIEPEKRSRLSSVPTGALAFRLNNGVTPALDLEPVGVAFHVATNFDLQIDGDEVVETFSVSASSPPVLPSDLSILTGDTNGRGAYRWFLRDKDNLGPLSLPVSDVIESDSDSEESVLVRLGDRDIGGRSLVGQRRYRLTGQMMIDLPSVTGAVRQDATAIIGEGLSVSGLGPTVIKVPPPQSPSRSANSTADVTIDASTDDSVSPNQPDGPSTSRDNDLSEISDSRSHTKLRYDPATRPTILVEASHAPSDANIVWHSNLTVTASSSGSDVVQADLDVSMSQRLVIAHDADLILVSITRDGQNVDLNSIPTRPIRLASSSKREKIRLVWSRSHHGSRWLRRVRIPEVVARAVVLKSTTSVVPATDSFSPASLLRYDDDEPISSSEIPAKPGQSILLMPRNLTLATGWLIATLVFAASWFAARRDPLFLMPPLVLFASLAFLWWPWQAAIMGWLIVPTITAGLLATSMAWWTDDADVPSGQDEKSFRARSADDSQEFSVVGGGSARKTPAVNLIRIFWIALIGAFAAGIAFPRFVKAQDGTTVARSDKRPFDVLVPLTGEGAVVGDKVYVPFELYEELFPAVDVDRAQSARFESAEYRVDLLQLRDGSARLAPLVEAEYVVNVAERTTRLRLPFSALAVRRVWLRSSDQDRIVRFVPDGDDAVIVTLPPGEVFRLRLTLIPKTTQVSVKTTTAVDVAADLDLPTESSEGTAILAPGSILKLRLAIPPIAESHLVIDGDRENDLVTVNEAFGTVQSDRGLRRWEADLGPVELLSIDYQATEELPSSSPHAMDRRYLVNVGRHRTSIECEVDTGKVYRYGDTVQLITLDPRIPQIASKHWQLKHGYRLSESRWSVSLEKTTDVEGAIRLFWQMPTVLDSTDQAQQTSGMTIPEVLPYVSSNVGETWIAINSDPSIEVKTEIDSEFEPLSDAQFLSRWSGYLGGIGKAFSTLDECPTLRARLNPVVQPSVKQQHHLQVTSGAIRLEYEAVIHPGENADARRTLQIPPGVKLINLTVDGESVDVFQATFADGTIGLPEGISGNKKTEVKAYCELTNRSAGRFRRPVIRISPAMQTSETYTVSRTRNVSVTPLNEANVASDLNAKFSDTFLLGGYIPVSETRIEDFDVYKKSKLSEGDSYLPGSFAYKMIDALFPTEQLIELQWEDGQWAMHSVIRFTKAVPAFIDIQIPTRWCDSLEVEPSPLWSRQPAIDPSNQVVRISLDADQVADQMLTIRGKLDENDQGRVSVPEVRVLGKGTRRVLVSLPHRLTQESIRWRTNAMRSQRLPKRFDTVASKKEDQQYFLATSSNWSVELANNPNAELEAIALAADVQLFPNDDRLLAACRWDIVPGAMESVSIRLPRDATYLGAWSAENSVSPQVVDEASVDGLASQRIIVPLSLSRLPQSVELLVSFPESNVRQPVRFPELIDLPVNRRWAVHYESDGVTTGASELAPKGLPLASKTAGRVPSDPASNARALSLARSVVSAVERSLDLLADRPADETETWFRPWANRYQAIATSQGRSVLWSKDPDDVSVDSANMTDQQAGIDSENNLGNQALSARRWQQLDRKMAEYASRFLSEPFAASQVRFGVGDFHGFHAAKTVAMQPNAPVPAISQTTLRTQSVRLLIRDLLTIAMMVGLILLCWPVRFRLRKWIIHPACWLAMIGMVGLFVAPRPVAVAILVVAVSLPVLSDSSRLKSLRG
tara:strand:- start:32137 stop:39381 length:7245 start_codon:yes stop_codon:yes gene_type:complete